MWRTRVAAAIAALALVAVPAGAGSGGRWTRRQLTFVHTGTTATYSCDGLAAKLRSLLRAAGARDDLMAVSICGAALRPQASAELTFWTLVPVWQGDATAAAWRPITIAPGSPRDLTTGDCELVEGFRDTVLKPLFTIRNVVDRVRCLPHQTAGSTIDLRFEALSAH